MPSHNSIAWNGTLVRVGHVWPPDHSGGAGDDTLLRIRVSDLAVSCRRPRRLCVVDVTTGGSGIVTASVRGANGTEGCGCAYVGWDGKGDAHDEATHQNAR